MDANQIEIIAATDPLNVAYRKPDDNLYVKNAETEEEKPINQDGVPTSQKVAALLSKGYFKPVYNSSYEVGVEIDSSHFPILRSFDDGFFVEDTIPLALSDANESLEATATDEEEGSDNDNEEQMGEPQGSTPKGGTPDNGTPKGSKSEEGNIGGQVEETSKETSTQTETSE